MIITSFKGNTMPKPTTPNKPLTPTDTPPVIRAIQLTKSFTFGNKIADRLYADDHTSFDEQDEYLLMFLHGKLYKIPKQLIVIEYA